ncbi:hypothetical protein ACQP2X_39385 [Actinoplanes sp. CA-131856]
MFNKEVDGVESGINAFGGACSAPRVTRRTASVPPLPESVLTRVVGDPDLIDRLGRHTHQVQMPQWICTGCGLDWPCEAAQDDLLLDLGWLKTPVLSGVLMELAAKHLHGQITPNQLWHRFIAWTEPPAELSDPLLTHLAPNR